MAQHTAEALSGSAEEKDHEASSAMSLAIDVFPQSWRGRLILAAVAVVVALVSFFLIGSWASSPETYADTIASLDAKRDTVLGFIGGATGLSGAITLLPGDAGTPIAEKLLDIGADFGFVLGAIYLEKYLLTVLGFAAFKVLVPLACLLVVAAALLFGRGVRLRPTLLGGAAKLLVFGIAIAIAVPVSISIADAIDATYQETGAAKLEASEGLADEALEAGEAAGMSEAGQTAGALEPSGESGVELGADTGDAASATGGEEDSDGFTISGFIDSVSGGVTETVDDVAQQAQEALNGFIETLAVMIVTSCVIPLLVLLFFLWLAKTILGLNVNVPAQVFAPRSLRRMAK